MISGLPGWEKGGCTCLNSYRPTAQQEAQRAQFLVEKAKQEQRQKIVQAEGEAEAAKMISFCCRELGRPLGRPVSTLPRGPTDETKANATLPTDPWLLGVGRGDW